MEETMTLTIRDHKGTCLESRVGTEYELNVFLGMEGYPFTVADIKGTEGTTDEDGQVYYIAR